MEIADLDVVRRIGEEYGWNNATIEQALCNAIRLCYAERGMLVEADVNLELGTITCRRRNGVGERGLWVDIRKPIMPSVKMFMQIIEMQQWGDGSPGRVMEGTVTGYKDGGVIYKVAHNMVFVPENLLSVMDFHERPQLGTEQAVALCSSKDKESGMRVGTRRGYEFVASVMDCYYPDCISGIWMGASNSWAVIRMQPDVMTEWLENGGVNVKHLQEVLGIRRITLIPEGEGEDEQQARDSELRHFVNNAWKACRIKELLPNRIVLFTPMDANDPRKLRTFSSMLQKIAPEREQVVL